MREVRGPVLPDYASLHPGYAGYLPAGTIADYAGSAVNGMHSVPNLAMGCAGCLAKAGWDSHVGRERLSVMCRMGKVHHSAEYAKPLFRPTRQAAIAPYGPHQVRNIL
jgi:hypothetical protein